MTRLAWIAPELGSAPGFPKDTIVPHTAEELARRGAGVLAERCVLYPQQSMPLLLSAELPDCRQTGSCPGGADR
jgi:hypothetical protein